MAAHRHEFTIKDALRGFSRFYRRGLLTFVVIVFLVGLATLLSPKSYVSEAKLFVRLGRENVGLDATTTLGHTPSVQIPLHREDEIKSVADIIQSRGTIEKVVDELGAERLLKPPKADKQGADSEVAASGGFSIGALFNCLPDGMKWLNPFSNVSQRERAVIYFGKKLTVVPVDKATVIHLRYETYSPELAQEALNSLIRHYTEQHARLNRTPGGHEFLQSQKSRLQTALNKAEGELEALKSQAGMLAPVDQREALVERITYLENELLRADAIVAASETELAELHKKLKALEATRVISQTTGAGNEAVDGMRQELFRLQSEEQDLLSTFQPTNYRVQAIRQRIQALTDILADEEAGRTETIQGPSKLYEETRLEIIRKEPMLAASRVKQAKLRTQLEEARASIESFARNELKYQKLEREVAINDASYRKYANNLEQALIDHALEAANISNISLAQPATLQEKPYRPNKLVNLVLGFGMGGVAALALVLLSQYCDRTLMTDEAVAATLELPLAASLPKQRHVQPPRIASRMAGERPPISASVNGALSHLDSQIGELVLALTTSRGATNGTGKSKAKAVAITSCLPGEGVTTVATRTAIAAAAVAPSAVLLVDANIDQPTLHAAFGLQANPGLLNCLEQGELLAGAVQESGFPQLKVMTAGYAEKDLAVLRDDHHRLQSMLQQLKDQFELILFDFPPASGTNLQLPWLEYFDSVYLVVESERTLAESARRTKRRIVEAGGCLQGVIHNKRQIYLTDRLVGAE